MNILMASFKKTFSFEERFAESQRVLYKYPERVPIICEKYKQSTHIPEIDKKKYLVPVDLTFGQFIYVIRRRLNLSSEKAIFLFVNGNIPASSSLIYHHYSSCKDRDGFLYVTYSSENVFG